MAVAGDVTAAAVRTELEARLGAWSVAAPAPVASGPAPTGLPSRTESVQRSLTQATILLGRATVARKHPDFYPLLVASQILGGGSSSRLYIRVREERGLAYNVYAQYVPARLGGLFLVELQSGNARVSRGSGGGAGGAGAPPARASVGRGAGACALLPDRKLVPGGWIPRQT